MVIYSVRYMDIVYIASKGCQRRTLTCDLRPSLPGAYNGCHAVFLRQIAQKVYLF